MRESRFWELMNDEFGHAYARSVAGRQVLTALDGLTPDEALEAGLPPRGIWDAVCDQMGVPAQRRLGQDKSPQEPRPIDL